MYRSYGTNDGSLSVTYTNEDSTKKSTVHHTYDISGLEPGNTITEAFEMNDNMYQCTIKNQGFIDLIGRMEGYCSAFEVYANHP